MQQMIELTSKSNYYEIKTQINCSDLSLSIESKVEASSSDYLSIFGK